MASSIYPIPITLNATPIAADTDIFSSPIVITAAQVSPGGGATLRLSFSIDPDKAVVTIFNGGSIKGILNADNDGLLNANGLYRFDIDVEAGDSLNARCSLEITTLHQFRAHLVQIGA